MTWTSLESQIVALERSYYASLERATTLLSRLPEDRLWRAPEPGRWSAGECLVHLNLTHRAMLAGMDAAVRGASAPAPTAPYRLDFKGWLLVKFLEPSHRMRL